MSTEHKSAPKRRRLWPWLTGIVAVAACLLLVFVAARDVPATKTDFDRLLSGVGIDPQPGAQVPLDIVLRDETGGEVRLGDLAADRPIVLALVYYRCPMLCGMVLEGLVRSMKQLSLTAGQDFTLVVVSFDARETPELAAAARQTALDRYGRAGSERGWRFLTGDEQPVRALADAVGFHYQWDESTQQFAHAAGVVILTSAGRVSRYLFGVEYPPRDLKLALIDASGGHVGSSTDRVLLLCYHYDPTTGRYGLAILSALRLAGLTTVLSLSLFIVLMLRRDHQSLNPKPAATAR